MRVLLLAVALLGLPSRAAPAAAHRDTALRGGLDATEEPSAAADALADDEEGSEGPKPKGLSVSRSESGSGSGSSSSASDGSGASASVSVSGGESQPSSDSSASSDSGAGSTSSSSSEELVNLQKEIDSHEPHTGWATKVHPTIETENDESDEFGVPKKKGDENKAAKRKKIDPTTGEPEPDAPASSRGGSGSAGRRAQMEVATRPSPARPGLEPIRSLPPPVVVLPRNRPRHRPASGAQGKPASPSRTAQTLPAAAPGHPSGAAAAGIQPAAGGSAGNWRGSESERSQAPRRKRPAGH